MSTSLSRSVFEPLEPRLLLNGAGPIEPGDSFFDSLLNMPSPLQESAGSILAEALQSEYDQGTKHYYYVGGSLGEVANATLKMFVDLDDLYQMSAEGQEANGGWVTVYGRFDLSVSISWPPILAAGYYVRRDINFDSFDPNSLSAADPYWRTQAELLSGGAGWKFSVINQTGEGPYPVLFGLDTNTVEFGVSLTLASTSFALGPWEMKREGVLGVFNSALARCTTPSHILDQSAFASTVANSIWDEVSGYVEGDPRLRFPATVDDTGLRLPDRPDFTPCHVRVSPVHGENLLVGDQAEVKVVLLNDGYVDGVGHLRVYLDGAQVIYDSGGGPAISLPSTFGTPVTFTLDTSGLSVGPHELMAEVYNVTPLESNTSNNIGCWSFFLHELAKPVAFVDSVTVSPGPGPALQGRDNVTFLASADDPDDIGTDPKIRLYRWQSNLGRLNDETLLYEGLDPSFSVPASDLKPGTHGIDLVVQDNEGDWSEPVTTTLVVEAEAPGEGHDLLVGLYVTGANIIHSPTSPATGEVWATNLGEHAESGTVAAELRSSAGTVLDSETHAFSALVNGQSTPHWSFSLSPGGYQGDATVHAQVIVDADCDRSNNESSIPLAFSTNLNPTSSFDNYEDIWLSNGEHYTGRDGTQFLYEDTWFYVNDESFSLGSLQSGDYVFLPNLVFKYGGYWPTGNEHIFHLWWDEPQSLYSWSTQFLTVPWGGTGSFEITRSSGSWPTISNQDVEFFSGLLPSGWSSSVTRQGSVMTVNVHAPYGSGSPSYNGWAHLKPTSGTIGSWWHAFQWMNVTAVGSPPNTAITAGPPAMVTQADVSFSWSGFDDTTLEGQLEYSYRLDPIESGFSVFGSATEIAYTDLADGSYTLFVKARDLGGIEDPTPASWSFEVDTNRTPMAPVNQYPMFQQAHVPVTPVLMASPFSDPDNGDMHAGTEVHIRADSGTYATPVFSEQYFPGIVSMSVPSSSPLGYSTKYWWCCRYQDGDGVWGPWSGETSFVTQGLPPEVIVLGPVGEDVPDGQSVPIDFGSAESGQPALTKTFTVRNDGEEMLFLGMVGVPAGFAVTQPSDVTLDQSESTTFAVSLLTETTGAFSGDVSFNVNDSDENPFNFAVTGAVVDTTPPNVTLVELNSGFSQRSKVTSTAITFSEEVTLSAGALSLHNDTTGEDFYLSTVPFNATMCTWDTSDVALTDGYYTGTLAAAGIEDTAGNAMASDYIFTFHVLKCDANGDAKVDGGDLALWQQHYDPLAQNPNTPGMGDWNGDGKVDGGDLALWQQRYNPLGLAAPMKAGATPMVAEAEPASASEPMVTPLATADVSAGSSGSESAAVGGILGNEFLGLSTQGDAETGIEPLARGEATLPEAKGTAISAAAMPGSMAQADSRDAAEPLDDAAVSLWGTGAKEPEIPAEALGLDDGLEDILSLAELILPLAE